MADGTWRRLASGGPVRAVALDNVDGVPQVVSGGDDRSVLLWHVEQPEVLQRFTGHTLGVRAVTVVQVEGDDRIVSASEDRTVRLWDPQTGGEVLRFTRHTGRVCALATVVVEGSPHVISAGADKVLRVWDPVTGEEVQQIAGHRAEISALAIGRHEGSEMVVSGGYDGVIVLSDLVTGKTLDQLAGHAGAVWALSTTAEQTDHSERPLVVSAGYDGSIRVWGPVGGWGSSFREVRRLDGHQGAVRTLASGWSPYIDVFDEEAYVIGGDEDGWIHLWDAATGRHVRALGTGHVGAAPLRALSWRRLGAAGLSRAVSGGDDGTVRTWDLTTGQEAHRQSGHRSEAWRVVAARTGGRQRVVTAGIDGTVRAWDADDIGVERRRLDVGPEPLLAVTPAGPSRDQDLVVVGIGSTVALWDIEREEKPGSVVVATISDMEVESLVAGLALSAQQSADDAIEAVAHARRHVPRLPSVAAVDADGVVHVWMIEAITLPVHDGLSRVLSRSHTLALDADVDWSVTIGSIAGREVVFLGGSNGRVLWWDPTADTDDSGSVRDLLDRKVEFLPGGKAGPEEVVTWGPPVMCIAVGRIGDSEVVLAGDVDGGVRAWDALNGELLRRFEGHSAAVRALVVASLGGDERVVSAGDDGTVRVWDLASGLEVQDPLLPHEGAVLDLAVFDDERVATVGADGMLVVQPLVATRTAVPWRAHTAMFSDEPTAEDRIGSFDLVARAVADFLLDPDTQPPVTIGLKGPWGGGKSSIMLMIREMIDRRDASGHRRPFPLPESTRTRRGIGSVLARVSRRRDQLTAGEAIGLADEVDEVGADEGDAAGGVSEARLGPAGLGPERQRLWRPTVWFNPWHHQTGDQVWAGLATSIVEQVTGRMSRLDRERFFLRLNRARVEPDALRRGIYGLLWRQVALPLAGLTAGAVLVAATCSVRAAVAGLSLSSVMALARSWVVALRAPVERVQPALVRSSVLADLAGGTRAARSTGAAGVVADPGHTAHVGYSYLAYVDLKRVIDLVATPQRPLVIFVDDLDRCSPSAVAQTLEAINLFLAGPFENCNVVMAVEPTMLAAHIDAAYAHAAEALRTAGTAQPDQQLGWRFLEKMVQVPVTVPRPTPQQASRYLTGLLPAIDAPDGGLAGVDAAAGGAGPDADTSSTGPAVVAQGPSDRPGPSNGSPPTTAARRHERTSRGEDIVPSDGGLSAEEGELRRSAVLAGLPGAGASGLARSQRPTRSAPRAWRAPPESGGLQASEPGEPDTDPGLAPAQERFARNLASEPAFHEACNWAAENLVPSFNPRQLKRMLAMIEVYTLIANRLGYLALRSPETLAAQLREIGVLAALNVRWPHQVERLLAPEAGDLHGRLLLDRLAGVGGDDAPAVGPPRWLDDDLGHFLEAHRDALGMASRLTTLRPARSEPKSGR